MNRQTIDGMRRFLEMIGLVERGETPGVFLTENIRDVAPEYPVMNIDTGREVAVMLNYTAEGGSLIAHRLMHELAKATGRPFDALLQAMGDVINTYPVDDE